MMPGIGPRNDERKKRALIAGFIGGGAVMAYVVVVASRFSAWEWVPLAAGFAVLTAIAVAGFGAGAAAAGGAAAFAGAAGMMMTGRPARRRTGGACWSWCRG